MEQPRAYLTASLEMKEAQEPWRISMKRANIAPILLFTAGMALPVLSGCLRGARPDEKAAVYSALDKNNLRSIMVGEDRRSGVLTLAGIVEDESHRLQAENLARAAAPGYTVADHIQVKPLGLQASEKPAPTTK